MKNISINYEYNNIKAAGTYNNRLYLLDAENNKILRYNRNGNSFSPAYSWIGESAILKNAVDMSIDGHVYILNSDGEIFKFLRGIKQDFNLESVDPKLENPTRLFVSFEKKYIYILEPSKQRLLIFDKTGQFILQYKSDTFTNLKDFAVDENNKIILCL